MHMVGGFRPSGKLFQEEIGGEKDFTSHSKFSDGNEKAAPMDVRLGSKSQLNLLDQHMYLMRVANTSLIQLYFTLILGPKRMALHTDEPAKCLSTKQKDSKDSVA